MFKVLLLSLILVGCSNQWTITSSYQEPQPTMQQEYSYECKDGFVWRVNWTKTIYALVYNSNGTEMICLEYNYEVSNGN